MFQHPGVYTDSLRITIRYGTAHTIKDTIVGIAVHVSGITLPAVADITVRAANGCQPIDTVIHVENLHCIAGTLDSMSAGDPNVSQAADSAFPIFLPPDSSVPIHIRVYPPKSGSVLAAITLHFDIDSTIFDTVIYVTVITKSDPSPHPILSQNKIAFGPSSAAGGARQAALDLHIPLVGSIASPTPVAQCGILLDGKSRDTVPAGGKATIALHALDAIPDSLGLADVSFDLNCNDNLLTKLPVVHPGPGFTTGTVQSVTGSLTLQFLRVGHAPIAAGDPIGSVDFFVTIGDTLSTPIALRNLRFNASDPAYEECTLSALAAQDTVYLTLSNTCGTPLLEGELRGNLLVFGVQPTIVAGGEDRGLIADDQSASATRINIDLSLKTASTVSVRLFTTLGEEIAIERGGDATLHAGRQTLSLELGHIPQGVAFLEISDGFEKYVRKVVFE